MSFIADNKVALIFYTAVILLIILNRKKFDMHGIIALYRTKIGLGYMERTSTRHREWVKLLGYIGIGAAYVGLLAISFFLFKNLYDLFTVPTAQSAVVPILPGIQIGGFKLPLVAGWLALFVVVVIHEFSHGIVSLAHNLKLKSSGFFFLGPLMGAFVEPDEKRLRKSSDVTQYSILAAGPFSNMLTAAIIILILNLFAAPVQGLLTEPQGFELQNVLDDYPAKAAGLEPGMIITEVNNERVVDTESFIEAMQFVKPEETVYIKANETTYSFATTVNPDNNKTAYLGVLGVTSTQLKNPTKFNHALNAVLAWFIQFLSLVGGLSLGIGLINLFPIFITDGARMLQVSLINLKGKEKGFKIWKNANILGLMVLLLNLFFPLFKWLANLT